MSLLPAFDKARILVVGDVMLDRYWFGDVERISPEAPVPVLKVGRVEERPGGAANVARNIAALGAHCTLLSVVGEDEAGVCLEKLLAGQGGVAASLHRDATISTTIKLRAIARHQQLLRIDFETQPSHEVLKAKLADFRIQLPGADVVILSDYGKGGLAHIGEMIRLARAAGKPVLVDPKGEDYARYSGATLLTPNRSEFHQVAGGWKSEAELSAKAERLRVELGLDALLVTRSEEGMSLYRAGEALHEAAQAREVFDVSGAGDTVIATIATMLASGAGLPLAMRIANRAAGIVVGKLGTAVVSREEIIKDIGEGGRRKGEG
ncbi:MAG: rfaE bifunctional protein [Gallionellaceae bacterium]|nr:MAG: rfaE bifunctional protein [Gallionellaceae bacterium]